MSELTQVVFPVLQVEQPIGTFYVGVMKARDLLAISFADMRGIESDLDDYVGIQRKLSPDRVREIADFVNSIDATFPTSVVLAVSGSCAEVLPSGSMRVFSGIDPETGVSIPLSKTASILDGQHRVEGLKVSGKDDFDVPVSIFVDADIADQAYIFATVNLAQTKVNKSLVYDLLDFSKARSPQKTAHEIAVAFDRLKNGPFEKSIKRLGAATPGRSGETLAQATVVNSIIPLISKFPQKDRYALAKGKKINSSEISYHDAPLRLLWLNERDGDIAKILNEYFKAVRDRWPEAWATREKGAVLARTNGFRALMRLFKDIYLNIFTAAPTSDWFVSSSKFLEYLSKSKLADQEITVDNFKPGTSGETGLYRRLKEDLAV